MAQETTDPRPPRAAKAIWSVAHLPRAWYVLALSEELGPQKPVARMLYGCPLVLFRDAEGKPAALVDRCPHRNVPLSIGRVTRQGELECAYHGWRFDRTGACRFIPSLEDDPGKRGRRPGAHACLERDGFIWVWGAADEEPQGEPYRFRLASDVRYTTVRRRVQAEGTLHQTLENALDVPHTAFLHRGLFRTKSRGIPLKVVIRRGADRVEAEFIGEPRPTGLVGRIFSPSGGIVTHFDRFILPSIAEIEYSIGEENHIFTGACATPVSDFLTHLYASVSFRTRLPGRLIQKVALPFALAIFNQDAKILKVQTENLKRFGGEQFTSTPIDVLGRHILRLLRAAERGETLKEPQEKAEAHEEVTLVV